MGMAFLESFPHYVYTSGMSTPALLPTDDKFMDPNAPDNAADPSSPPNEMATAAYVTALFQQARSARRPMVARWKRNYRSLHNRIWAARQESWQPAPEVSQTFPVIFSCVAWMTDQRPNISVTPSPQPFSPYSDFYSTLANDMNATLAATFSGNSLDAEIPKALWDVMTYGVGYFRTTWEAWLADGIGDTAFRRVDPFAIYPDPYARNMNDLTYIIEAQVMTTSDVDRAWPGAGKRVRGGAGEIADAAPTELDESVSATGPRVTLGNLPTSSNTMYAMTGGGRDRARAHVMQDDPTVTVLTAWVRTHEVTDTDDKAVKGVRDIWRCIVTCGSTVLMDSQAEDLSGYTTHPYDKVLLTDLGEWYGPSLVEMLDSPQERIGCLLASIEQNIALMGNPVLVESARSQSRGKKLTNRPGQRIEADPAQIKWLDPPQIQSELAVSLIQFYKGEIESISGLSAMVRGFSPGGRNSAGVLDQVQDAAFVRVRASLRQLELALRGVCSKMAANIAEFYTEARMLAIQGPDGQQTTLALRARHFYTRDQASPDDRIPLRFTLLADAGSQLPTSKQARAAQAQTLFAIGAIDTIEVLKASDWPNYAVVAKRVMEQQAAGLAAAAGKREQAHH